MRTCLAFLLCVLPADGNIVSYDFSGVVTRLNDYQGDNLISVVIGDPVSGSIDLDLGSARTYPMTLEGIVKFRDTAARWSLNIDGSQFVSHDTGIVTIYDDFGVDGNGPLDMISLVSPSLHGDTTIYKTSLSLRDNSADMIDSLSIDNLQDIDFFEHDGTDHFRLAGIVLDNNGASLGLDWDTFDRVERSHIIGDANLDGYVNATDLNTIGMNWRSSASWTGGDFTGDGMVDAADMNGLALNWAKPQASAVPEPSTAVLILSVLLSALIRQRHADN